MSTPRRSCIFPGCHSVQGNGSVSLFRFPTDDNLRKRWIDFVKRSYDGELKITTNTRLCSVHFTPDSYSNYHQVKSGFLKSPLTLVSGAEPTLSVPGLHPTVPPTGSATITATGIMCPPPTGSATILATGSLCPPPTLFVLPTGSATITATGSMCPPPTLSVPPTGSATITATGSMCPPPTGSATITATGIMCPPPTGSAAILATGRLCLPPTLSVLPTAGAIISAAGGIMWPPESSPPTTSGAACQKKDTRDIGCQTDLFVRKRTVATQLSKRTLISRISKGSQAAVSTKSVAVGDTTFPFLFLQFSTSLKRKTVAENPPTKSPNLEFPSIQESEPSVN